MKKLLTVSIALLAWSAVADNADVLEQRASNIGYMAGHIPDKLMWGWPGYTGQVGLRVSSLNDEGTLVDYRRRDNKRSSIVLDNIRAIGFANKRIGSAIPVGEAKKIDAQRIEIDNHDGLAALTDTYRANFARTVTESESFTAGFAQSLSNTFTAGNDSTPVKNETTLAVEFSQELSKGSEESETTERENTIDVTADPGLHIQVWGYRTIQKERRILQADAAKLDHGVCIGSHWDHKWRGHRGKGRTYPRHACWDSFHVDFLPVIEGRGSRNQPLAEHFRKNPVEPWLVNNIRANLELPFRQELIFDAVTKVQLGQCVVRCNTNLRDDCGLVAFCTD